MKNYLLDLTYMVIDDSPNEQNLYILSTEKEISLDNMKRLFAEVNNRQWGRESLIDTLNVDDVALYGHGLDAVMQGVLSVLRTRDTNVSIKEVCSDCGKFAVDNYYFIFLVESGE